MVKGCGKASGDLTREAQNRSVARCGSYRHRPIPSNCPFACHAGRMAPEPPHAPSGITPRFCADRKSVV